jgi:hypothetical protein
MIEKLPFFSEDVRSQILSIEGTLQELRKIKPQTKPETQFRRKLIDLLETSEASLIDAQALLLDAAMCHDEIDLSLFMSQVESEAAP